MARLSKVDAAKAAGVSRQTLYAYLKSGRLSADADGLIDTAELLRAGFALHTGHEIGRPPLDTAGQPLTSNLDTLDTAGQPLTSNLDMLDIYRQMLDMLTRQVAEARAAGTGGAGAGTPRPRARSLLQMVQDMQHRYDRLLDVPVLSPSEPPGGPKSHASRQTSCTSRCTPGHAPSGATARAATAPPGPLRPREICPRPPLPPRPRLSRTGQSLLRLPSRNCPACVNAHKREQRARRASGGLGGQEDWAWRGAWPIRAWGCCAMGWCSGWGEEDMWRESKQEP